MIKGLSVLFLSFFLSNVISAQMIEPDNMKIILNGVVYDEFTNEPVGVKIVFKDSSRIINSVKSNDATGMYQAVIQAGGVYKVEFTAWNIAKKEENVIIKDSKEFEEQKLNFYVKRFTKGIQFDSSDIFIKNGDVENEESKYIYEYFMEVMKFNRDVKFDFVVNAHDTFKEGSKAKEAEIKTLVDARVKKLTQVVESWPRLKSRIIVKADYSLGKIYKDNPLINENDLRVIVAEIKNGLE